MNQVVELLDRFDRAAPVRALQRDETQLYKKAVAGPFGDLATATELVEVIHVAPTYTPGEFVPPKVLFEAPRARIEWQQMDNRQPLYHRNLDVDEMSYQISGERTLMSEHGTVELRPGDFVRLPVGVCHDNWVVRSRICSGTRPPAPRKSSPQTELGRSSFRRSRAGLPRSSTRASPTAWGPSTLSSRSVQMSV